MNWYKLRRRAGRGKTTRTTSDCARASLLGPAPLPGAQEYDVVVMEYNEIKENGGGDPLYCPLISGCACVRLSMRA